MLKLITSGCAKYFTEEGKEENDRYFIVSELAENGDLFDIIHQRNAPFPDFFVR